MYDMHAAVGCRSGTVSGIAVSGTKPPRYTPYYATIAAAPRRRFVQWIGRKVCYGERYGSPLAGADSENNA